MALPISNGMKKTTIIIIVLTLGLISSIAYSVSRPPALKECKSDKEFISPDIVCDEGNISAKTEFLKKLTELEVNKYIASGKAKKLAVFYRNLGNRQWFGVNENEPFAPGSLLKLPLAISYYKLAELDSSLLDRGYEYKQSYDSGSLYDYQTIKPTELLVEGRTYSIRELIYRMVRYSDNEVVPVLTGSINKSFFDQVYLDLGVYIPTTIGIEQNFLSVKTYAAILRALYNASYLNRQYSNELLAIMSESAFDSGIKGGIPYSVKLANKFGERVFMDPATNKVIGIELHDCGIVYANPDPYILCVMTDGGNFADLSEAIADISRTVYENR